MNNAKHPLQTDEPSQPYPRQLSQSYICAEVNSSLIQLSLVKKDEVPPNVDESFHDNSLFLTEDIRKELGDERLQSGPHQLDDISQGSMEAIQEISSTQGYGDDSFCEIYSQKQAEAQQQTDRQQQPVEHKQKKARKHIEDTLIQHELWPIIHSLQIRIVPYLSNAGGKLRDRQFTGPPQYSLGNLAGSPDAEAGMNDSFGEPAESGPKIQSPKSNIAPYRHSRKS